MALNLSLFVNFTVFNDGCDRFRRCQRKIIQQKKQPAVAVVRATLKPEISFHCLIVSTVRIKPEARRLVLLTIALRLKLVQVVH